MSIGSARREVGEERAGPNGSIPGPRTAADAYRVSDDQIHRARLVVARNCADPDDLHECGPGRVSVVCLAASADPIVRALVAERSAMARRSRTARLSP